MTAYLTFTAGTRQERIPCKGVITIGRDKNNDVVLADMLVSRSHAIVRRVGDGVFYLVDSGSSNGTFVNSQRVAAPTLLRNGDRIIIGLTEFTFEQKGSPGGFNETSSFQETVIFHTPVIKEITVLVADIRGFTSLSEQVPIQTLSRLMSKWFQDVNNIIQKGGGVVDKFIGDCVFARWESDNPRNNVIRALRTALQVHEATEGLIRTFAELPHPLHIGAGINTGMASLGIGADNTALGDAVNTAFRLETATKELGKDVALSESSYRYLPEHYWSDSVRLLDLKGKKEQVWAYCADFADIDTILKDVYEE